MSRFLIDSSLGEKVERDRLWSSYARRHRVGVVTI